MHFIPVFLTSRSITGVAKIWNQSQDLAQHAFIHNIILNLMIKVIQLFNNKIKEKKLIT